MSPPPGPSSVGYGALRELPLRDLVAELDRVERLLAEPCPAPSAPGAPGRDLAADALRSSPSGPWSRRSGDGRAVSVSSRCGRSSPPRGQGDRRGREGRHPAHQAGRRRRSSTAASQNIDAACVTSTAT